MSFHTNTQIIKRNFDKKKLYTYDGDKPDEKKKKNWHSTTINDWNVKQCKKYCKISKCFWFKDLKLKYKNKKFGKLTK